jgi:glycosyltransferase involved in cell wall biosynthesis
MSQELVSAIIITHNRIDLVQKAILSVKNQTYPSIELVVVDDASDDRTKEVLSKIADEVGFRYIYISKVESKGGNHARNVGIMASRGLYIALLDDDDEWIPEKIDKQIMYLKSNPDYGAVTCSRIMEYNFKGKKKQRVSDRLKGDLKAKIWSRTAFNTSEVMIRRDCFDKVGMFDEQLHFWQEYEFSIRLCQITPIGLIPEHLVLYRIVRKDKNRLTNNLVGWEEAVKYVDYKHRKLLDKVSPEIRMQHKAMIARDGAERSFNIGNYDMLKKYTGELFKLEPSIKCRIKYMFYSLVLLFKY